MQHLLTPFAALTAAFDVAHEYASSCMRCSEARRDAHAGERTWESAPQMRQPRTRHHQRGDESHPGMAAAMLAASKVQGVVLRPLCGVADAKPPTVIHKEERALQLHSLCDKVGRLEREVRALQRQMQELASSSQVCAQSGRPLRLHLSAAQQSEEGPRRDSAELQQCRDPPDSKGAASLPDLANGRDACASSQGLGGKDPLAESWGKARKKERGMYSAHGRCFWCGKKGFKDPDHPCRSHPMRGKRRRRSETGERRQ